MTLQARPEQRYNAKTPGGGGRNHTIHTPIPSRTGGASGFKRPLNMTIGILSGLPGDGRQKRPADEADEGEDTGIFANLSGVSMIEPPPSLTRKEFRQAT